MSNASGASVGIHDKLRVTIRDGRGANQAPNAIAGSNQTVSSGARVALSGGQSNDPDGDTLSYSWQQVLGPAVTIDDANSVSPAFTAPAVTSDTMLRFELTVNDPDGLDDKATTTVTVLKVASGGSGSGGPSGGSGGGALTWLLLILLLRVPFIRKGAA